LYEYVQKVAKKIASFYTNSDLEFV